MSRPASRSSRSTPEPSLRRLALAPALLLIVLLIAAAPLIGSDPYQLMRFGISILAVIIGIFAWQARAWIWLPVMAAIAVLWNPLWPLQLPQDVLFGLHYVGAIAALFAGFAIRSPEESSKA